MEKELRKLVAGIGKAGMDPEESPKVKELKQKIADDSVDVAALKNEVYDHLFSFFHHYYHEGDFLAKRVYKPGVYAIPYEGEEVKLHWSNNDQYYIKTNEYLRDYAFTLQPGDAKNPMRVHYRLVEVSEGEHGNIKAANGNDRVFILATDDFIFEEDGELVIHFHYRPATMNDWSEDGLAGAYASKQESERGPKIIKILPLESYEDALNNLRVQRTSAQEDLLNRDDSKKPGGLREQYVLKYMLDVESDGSNSLLNVSGFDDPIVYKLIVKQPGSDENCDVDLDLLETFNYLIGLTVNHIAAPQTFGAAFKRDDEGRLRIDGRLKQDDDGPWWSRTVDGMTPDGRKTLVIWRKLTGDAERDNLVLDECFTCSGYSTQDYEFDLIHVNGDNNLENLRQPDETWWKVRLIEEDFHRLMFDVENV